MASMGREEEDTKSFHIKAFAPTPFPIWALAIYCSSNASHSVSEWQSHDEGGGDERKRTQKLNLGQISNLIKWFVPEGASPPFMWPPWAAGQSQPKPSQANPVPKPTPIACKATQWHNIIGIMDGWWNKDDVVRVTEQAGKKWILSAARWYSRVYSGYVHYSLRSSIFFQAEAGK